MKQKIILVILVSVLFVSCKPAEIKDTETGVDEGKESEAGTMQLTEEECREYSSEWDVKSSFKNIAPECKDIQASECGKIYPYGTRLKQATCFFNLATSYNDGEICEYILETESNDLYWYCASLLKHGRSSCSKIDSESMEKDCLEHAPENIQAILP